MTQDHSAVLTRTIVDGDPATAAALRDLRADPRLAFIDRVDDQLAELRALRPAVGPDLLDEPTRWIYYPWRRAVVRVLGPCGFELVRLDRNRNIITAGEQRRLRELRVGVIGLSVGHVIAHTLAAEGICGELRLADFDSLALSNLNRVPASLFDLGVNKATAVAQRIAELDPYLDVRAISAGLSAQTMASFLDGLHVVVEECDSLDMKVLVRQAARAQGIPVVMATSDRGLLDIERFDLEPARPILHGLIGDLDAARLSDLTSRQKVPYVLRILDAATLSARGAASMVEVDKTLLTWPQVAGEVALGATAVAKAVRRIGLGEPLASGRVRIDVDAALNEVAEPAATPVAGTGVAAAEATGAKDGEPFMRVAAAAVRAPSGANVQPWHVDAEPGQIRIRLDPGATVTMDVGLRASAVAVGAATFNARVAAAAHGILGPAEFEESREECPLQAVVRFDQRTDDGLARLYEPMLRRHTNRHCGRPGVITVDVADRLRDCAREQGARLALMTDAQEIAALAGLLAESDRIRYLTPHLHAEMISELRWPGDASPETGIDVNTLGLDRTELVQLDVLRRPEVVAQLADWDAGSALGSATYDRVRSSTAVAVVFVGGHTLTDYARGGAATEAVWIAAQEHGLAVHPVSPVFLYAHTPAELVELSPAYAAALTQLRADFHAITSRRAGESCALVLRLFHAPAAATPSRRRSLRHRAT